MCNRFGAHKLLREFLAPFVSHHAEYFFLLSETDILGPEFLCSNNRSTPMESIVIHFSLQCRRVSINVTCSNMTQDQGFYRCLHVLVNVCESRIACGFLTNAVFCYWSDNKHLWIEIELSRITTPLALSATTVQCYAWITLFVAAQLLNEISVSYSRCIDRHFW